jgi:hypothetical protein
MENKSEICALAMLSDYAIAFELATVNIRDIHEGMQKWCWQLMLVLCTVYKH